MNFVEAGLTPIGFIETNLVFFLIVFFLALHTGTDAIRDQLKKRRALWWGLASIHIVFPIIVALVCVALFLPVAQSSGLILVATMPALALAALLTWLGHGNTALALLLVLFSTIISAGTAPLMFNLWTEINPMASRDMALLDYTPFYTLAVAICVILMPLGLGLLCARYLPAFRKIAPAALYLLTASALLIPLGVISSNSTQLLATPWSLGLTISLTYLAGLLFTYRLIDSLGLGKRPAISVVFSTVTHNMAIAGMFAVSGLGPGGTQILTALWWVVLQYYLGLLAALYFRRRQFAA